MKKFFFFAVLAIAFAGFGLQAGAAHAQTTGASSLQQQLDVAKATLINMQMQAGMIPQGDDQLASGAAAQPKAASGLTLSQKSYFANALGAVAASLQQLNATVSANPSMTASQTQAAAQVLASAQNTVLNIATQIAQAETAAPPIAMANPSPATPAAPSAGSTGASNNAPAPVAQTPTTGTGAGVAAATPATGTQQQPAVQSTAQASSIWSFTKTNWPVMVIVLLVIAILAILFWPEGEAKAPNHADAPMAATASDAHQTA